MADDRKNAMPFAASDSNKSTVNSSSNGALCRSPPPPRGGGSKINDCLFGTPSSKPRQARSAMDETIEVWPMSNDERECNDVIHQNISIPPAVQVILDTPSVQRLRDLKQLGCASFAYPCATHSRMEHSMGVMELARQAGTKFQQKQPQLNVSEKDVLCVGIAGLCHDLGHGPFSHCYEAFLKAAYKNERDHPEQYEERNRRFKEEFGVDMPPLPEHYEHEKTSLMMVDFALAHVGLEIDWDNLDEPLKQVRSGVDGTKFGVDLDGGDNVDVFTSRDWIFIKECIYGGPLDEPDAPTAQTDWVGRDPTKKEFLYDIVNNRHNGSDLDKNDYFQRDFRAAFGGSQGNLNIWMRDMCVARGICPNPSTCFQCKDKVAPGMHPMICYPMKHISSALDFFATRMKNHEIIYTHKKTKAAELQMVDMLVEADKHFSVLDDPCGFPVPSRFDDFEFTQLPLSRAWMFPRMFLQSDDHILAIIERQYIRDQSPKLRRLKQLINDRRSHRIYKQVADVEIGTIGDKVWDMSEDEIKVDLLSEHVRYTGEQPRHMHNGKVIVLNEEDFIVEKRELHYGRKEKNPVSLMRFLPKNDKPSLRNPVEKLPEAFEVTNLPTNTPKSFLRRNVRIFCRSQKMEKFDLIKHAFKSWEQHKMDEMEGFKTFSSIPEGIEEEDTEPDSQPITQQDDLSLSSTPRKRKHSFSDDSSSSPAKAKKKLF